MWQSLEARAPREIDTSEGGCDVFRMDFCHPFTLMQVEHCCIWVWLLSSADQTHLNLAMELGVDSLCGWTVCVGGRSVWVRHPPVIAIGGPKVEKQNFNVEIQSRGQKPNENYQTTSPPVYAGGHMRMDFGKRQSFFCASNLEEKKKRWREEYRCCNL